MYRNTTFNMPTSEDKSYTLQSKFQHETQGTNFWLKLSLHNTTKDM